LSPTPWCGWCHQPPPREGLLATGPNPGAVGEPGEEEEQGQRRDDGQADDGDAGGDGEDAPGVVETVVYSPGTAGASSARGLAGLDPERDAGEVGAAVQVREAGAKGGGMGSLGAELGFDRGALGVARRRSELGEQPIDLRP
jgi:hypothetical protein